MGRYVVRCAKDGSLQDPFALSCPEDGSLLRSDYSLRRLELSRFPGLWRFYEWLPVEGIIPQASQGSIAYRSLGLARELGLSNLYISFSGFWPERGAAMPTCTFKDLEAPPTMQRLRERGRDLALVLASAGNTGRAFAHVASLIGWPIVLFVPEKDRQRMWTTIDSGPVSLFYVKGDYYRAIEVAEKVQSRPGYIPEGGARNIARRDGMGTVLLEAALTMGRIPQHYFQAVGSGTGGIAAWEAGLRLREDGRYGTALPRLHLAQNIPNAPIYYAWRGEELPPAAEEMFDDVLYNRHPPYGVSGGVKDALLATGGEVYGATDEEAAEAKGIFEAAEGIDILNAAAIAVAALIQAVDRGAVGADEFILINITGGGEGRLAEEESPRPLPSIATVSSAEEALEYLEERS
jgi:cysteate synthase